MPLRRLWECLIHALGCDEVLEGLFIDSFACVDTTFEAFEVPGGLSILVFVMGWCLLLLPVQEVFDDLGPGELFGQGFSLGWQAICIFNPHLRTVFMKSGLKNAFGQTLMHSGTARSALVPASMWFPSVMVFCPAFATLFHQLTLVLFGVLPLMSGCFLVNKVLGVVVDLGQPLDSMGVNQLVVGV